METKQPTLVIMAAGIGSRYGAVKQLEAFGPNAESLMDYAIYDAIQLNFGKIVIVVRAAIEQEIQQRYAHLRSKGIQFEIALQSNDVSAFGISNPIVRIKPWGTGQALLSAANHVAEPLVVINADDFYGRETLAITAANIMAQNITNRHTLTAFRLKNTLSDYGTVSRAICQKDDNNHLIGIREIGSIKRNSYGIIEMENEISFSESAADQIVSMNCWGFQPSVFLQLKQLFTDFLNSVHNQNAEFFLPSAIQQLIDFKEIVVEVNSTEQAWFGITWPEDKKVVRDKIFGLIQEGVYPECLF